MQNFFAFLKKNYFFVVIAVLSIITRFFFLDYPQQLVFDETYFVRFANNYFTHKYYIDIHPPLGKLLIAGWSQFIGIDLSYFLHETGREFSSNFFFALRSLPALFGSVFVLLFSYLAYLISHSKKVAIIAGFLILFDNAFLIQSRFVHLDIFLVFFAILTLCLFLLQQKQKLYSFKWFIYLLLTGISFGLAVSIKWSGLAVFIIIIAILFLKIFNKKFNGWLFFRGNSIQKTQHCLRAKSIESIISVFVIFYIGFATYTLPFFIHFELLHKIDNGYAQAVMSKQFQEELKYGKENIQNPLTFWQKFSELNQKMLHNLNTKTNDPNRSYWYQWPFDKKPILFWSQNIDKSSQNGIAAIYFLGNPSIWIFSTFFVLLALFKIFVKKKIKPASYILLLSYFIAFLPFIAITRRSTFLYHYLLPETFAIIILSIYLKDILSKNKAAFTILFIIIIINFILLIPFSYGLSMAPEIHNFEMKLINFF